MNHPRVTKIRVEYEDGSHDDVELLPGVDFPLYDLRRKTATKRGNIGACCGDSIGAFLFYTTSTTRRREFSEMDTLSLLTKVQLKQPGESSTQV